MTPHPNTAFSRIVPGQTASPPRTRPRLQSNVGTQASPSLRKLGQVGWMAGDRPSPHALWDRLRAPGRADRPGGAAHLRGGTPHLCSRRRTARSAPSRRRRDAGRLRERGERLTAEIGKRLPQLPRPSDRPRVTVVEWLAPPMLAAHWVSDVVEAAGGEYVGPRPGTLSPTSPATRCGRFDPMRSSSPLADSTWSAPRPRPSRWLPYCAHSLLESCSWTETPISTALAPGWLRPSRPSPPGSPARRPTRWNSRWSDLRESAGREAAATSPCRRPSCGYASRGRTLS